MVLKTKETSEPSAETTYQQAAEPQGEEPTETTSSETPTEETASGVCVCLYIYSI